MSADNFRLFIDHAGTIDTLRLSMMKEVEAMLEPIGELDCEGSGVAITTVDNGNLDVKTIYYNYAGKQVEVKDNLGECHDYSELDTDDMNAIYEHVYYRVIEKA
jgi:hypothetical protein